MGKRVPMQHKRPAQEDYFGYVVWEQLLPISQTRSYGIRTRMGFKGILDEFVPAF